MAELHSFLDIRSKNLFKRCVECDPVVTATCPVCTSNEVCTLTTATCTQCPVYTCQNSTSSGAVDTNPAANPSSSGSKSIAPQIAGGIIGGIAVIGLITWIIWRFVLKGKRRESVMNWEPMDYPMEKPVGGAMSPMANDARSRASTHTVTSMASTVLTRASNVIQIAYIPGVMNRQSSAHGDMVPPVPPIPIPTASNSMVSSHDDHILFMPGDLRDSTFTDMSELDIPTRKSIAPSLARTSIASAIVQGEAITAFNAKARPAMVTVAKSPAMSLPATPPVPSIDMKRFNSNNNKGPQVLIPASIEKSGNATGQLKAKTVTITKKSSKTTLASNLSTPNLDGSELQSTPLSHASTGRIISLVESQTTYDSPHGRAIRIEEDDGESDIEGASPAHERARKSVPGAARGVSPFTDAAALAEQAESPIIKGDGPFGDDKAI